MIYFINKTDRKRGMYMEQVNIHSVEKIKPCTLELNGYVRGNSRFYAELQGVCLEIFVGDIFDDDERNELEEKIYAIFKPAMKRNGIYDKRKINSIMKKNNEVILIRVGEE